MNTTNIMSLNQASSGNYYKVISIRLNKTDRRRISDLGLITNTKIKMLQKSPLGDPIAYLIRGTVIALRSEYTKKIIVQKV